MTEQQKAICDGFVYIRQYGPGTASLNVSVAASIVMHHFALWAGYDERLDWAKKIRRRRASNAHAQARYRVGVSPMRFVRVEPRRV